jgi:hypothetical protein
MDVWIFCIVFIGGGIFSLIIGLIEHFRWRALIKCGVKTRGIARTVTDDDDCVKLVVTFIDQQGITYKVSTKGGATVWTALDGHEVDVLYEPKRPEQARIVLDLSLRRKLSINWFGLLYIGIGVVVLILHLLGIDVLD